jgi:DNA-binding transcriptional ArsR family regulator
LTDPDPTGHEFVEIMAALSNPVRIQILARLAGGRDYVSRLAREIGISRPLLHMHLQRLESAGLVTGTLEVSEDGKAMRFYEVTNFDLRVTPEAITRASTTLTSSDPAKPLEHKEQ